MKANDIVRIELNIDSTESTTIEYFVNDGAVRENFVNVKVC